MKKVVITGPESTGKSTLSSLLAKQYQTVWVPEYARTYIDNLDRDYEKDDLITIAQGQLNAEKAMAQKAQNNLLICDTELIVIKIWAEHKYGVCPHEIIKGIKENRYDLYLLTYIDIPWEDDPQRENPHLRQYFYDLFKKELEYFELPYVEINGGADERLAKASQAINSIL
ncbi:AAA family ATPase [Fulvivirga sediminis]|uniref:ATP-binding protein n=1 Tax=Fulvivirga sediminis TaxID=2803949 RepID=A0A937JZU4_9BACT|nr:ATP-binding protein [Fulvivirga sediminis]MBL3657713.1 ATP-binding protein [Fulvivirga sediminis]